MMVLDLTVNAHTDLCPFEDKVQGHRQENHLKIQL